jgi:hypothetical protein
VNVTKYDPAHGQCFQGDIMVLPLPAGITLATGDEIKMRGGMLVLAEGEVTGHHHAIRYGLGAASQFHDGALARSLETVTTPAVGTAKMYRDPAALAILVRTGVLVTDALCIGFLRIDGECPPLTHDEHGAIQIPPGDYYVGAKREQDASETRRVAD